MFLLASYPGLLYSSAPHPTGGGAPAAAPRPPVGCGARPARAHSPRRCPHTRAPAASHPGRSAGRGDWVAGSERSWPQSGNPWQPSCNSATARRKERGKKKPTRVEGAAGGEWEQQPQRDRIYSPTCSALPLPTCLGTGTARPPS